MRQLPGKHHQILGAAEQVLGPTHGCESRGVPWCPWAPPASSQPQWRGHGTDPPPTPRAGKPVVAGEGPGPGDSGPVSEPHPSHGLWPVSGPAFPTRQGQLPSLKVPSTPSSTLLFTPSHSLSSIPMCQAQPPAPSAPSQGRAFVSPRPCSDVPSPEKLRQPSPAQASLSTPLPCWEIVSSDAGWSS